MNRIATIFLFALLIGLIALNVYERRPRRVSIESTLGLLPLGSEVPTLVLVTVVEDTIRVPTETEALLSFFQTTCPACKGAISSLREIQERDCLQMYMVTPEGLEAAEAFWDRWGWTPSCGQVVIGTSPTSLKPFGVTQVPTFYWVGRDTVKGSKVGGNLLITDWRKSLQ